MKNETLAEARKITKRKKGTIKAQSEFFRTARYGLTLQEHRIIYYAILEGQQEGRPFEPVTLSVSEFKRMFELKGESSYSELRKLSLKLVGRTTEIAHKDDDGLKYTALNWLSRITYNLKEGTVTITPNKELKPFFEGKPFTTMEYYFLLKFTSAYAERLYEILKSLNHKTIIDFDIDDLAKRLSVPKSYAANYADLKKRVLDPAIKDINEFTDLDIDIRDKRGRYNKVTTVIFSLRQKEVPKLAERVERGEFVPPLSEEEQEIILRELLDENEIEGQLSMLDEAVFNSEND